jgi:ribonuclease-3
MSAETPYPQSGNQPGDHSEEGFGHSQALDEIEARMGYTFSDRKLLVRALTHRSFTNEDDETVGDNQRLEFLGDAVLGVIVADELFRRDREVQEGALSTRQAQVVCEPALAQVARNMQLGSYLRLGRGESASGGREKNSLLADACEALWAAVYLDGGLDAAREVVISQLGDVLEEVHEASALADFKSRLQTVIQREKAVQPQYLIIDESGPPHDKMFVAEVRVDGRPLGAGSGRSKKVAEQHAAEEALESLNADHGSD